jgi:hypothetical protein
VRHLNPRDCGAIIALDTRFATSNALPNRASSSGISFSVLGSPTFANGGQGGQNRLITTPSSGLYSSIFNPTSFFIGNKSILVSVWNTQSAGNYYAFYIADTDSAASLAGVATESNPRLLSDWGNFASGRTLINTSALIGTTAIRSQVFTGSAASLRQNGAQVASTSHSQAMASTNHRAVINGYFYSDSTIEGRQAGEFYAAIAIPIDGVSLAKRLEQSLAFSFKIACS